MSKRYRKAKSANAILTNGDGVYSFSPDMALMFVMSTLLECCENDLAETSVEKTKFVYDKLALLLDIDRNLRNAPFDVWDLLSTIRPHLQVIKQQAGLVRQILREKTLLYLDERGKPPEVRYYHNTSADAE